MAPLVYPPLDCSLVVHELIDFHVQHNPTFPMFVYADDIGTTQISFLEFRRAAHRAAHDLRPDRKGDGGQVVMIIANCDTLLYHAILVGLSIAGLTPFPVSPRNSGPAVVHMMKQTNCSRIVTLHHAHHKLIDEIRAILSDRELTIDEIPTISYAFPKLGNEVETDPFIPYPPAASRPDLNDPALYIHSSGSTGFPKPILQTHRIQVHSVNQPSMYYFRRVPAPQRVAVMALPPFHSFGVMAHLYLPIAHFAPSVIYPPQAVSDIYAAPIVPTPDNMLDSIRRTDCSVAMTVPVFLEHWAASEDAVNVLKSMDMIMFAGGPLAEKIGNRLYAAGVPLGQGYGGSEFGGPVRLPQRKDIEDSEWNWIRFSDKAKIRWVPYSGDTFECQILSTETNQMAVENLPDVKGYATSDLFIKHPTKDLWRIVGRIDDVITLASGEKTVPTPMENIIGSCPLVQGAVMFGRERNQVGVLVEPKGEYGVDTRDDNAVAVFRNKIWPFIEAANKLAPTFSRIFKEMILIADHERPMVRTPKGSVQKKQTIEAYTAKINALYDAVEDTYKSSSGSAGPSTWDLEAIQEWLMQRASEISQGQIVNPSADLFAQGFDSLSVTYLRNRLFSALRSSTDAKIRGAASYVSQNIIFENPTLERLAARVVTLVDGRGTTQSSDHKQRRVQAMNAMIEKYTTGLPGVVASVDGTSHEGTLADRAIVLLTGSTGGLGSFLLSHLLGHPGVERVYALNRPSSISIEKRQQSAFVDRGLSVNLLGSGKLVYVESEAFQDKCGLTAELYNEIRNSVTIIIHNAWRLDFNLTLDSFEPNVKATRNLIDLALESPRKKSLRFVFTSSVGTAQSWDRTQGPFPEEIQSDPTFAMGSGYAESKYVGERILIQSGLLATSLRIGQITGSANGCWATTDWVPILVKSGVALGALPDSRGVVSWMRTEDVAASVLEVAFAGDVPQALNIVNPQRPTWTEIITCIRDAIVKLNSLSNDDLTLISFAEWVARLENSGKDALPEDLVNIPALKLLDFFRSMAHNEELALSQGTLGETGGVAEFSTVKSQLFSKTVAQMLPLGETEAQSWVEYWGRSGLF